MRKSTAEKDFRIDASRAPVLEGPRNSERELHSEACRGTGRASCDARMSNSDATDARHDPPQRRVFHFRPFRWRGEAGMAPSYKGQDSCLSSSRCRAQVPQALPIFDCPRINGGTFTRCGARSFGPPPFAVRARRRYHRYAPIVPARLSLTSGALPSQASALRRFEPAGATIKDMT